jgi:hypothetical protein
MRIADSATVTHTELYPTHIDLLYELATRRVQPHEALDLFDVRWRDKYAVDSRFKVVDAADGPVIRMMSPDET